MSDNYVAHDGGSDDGVELDAKPLTPEEAVELRPKILGVSPWGVLGLQALAGLVVVVLMWLVFQSFVFTMSAAYGVLAVLVPAMFFARGLTRRQKNATAAQALVSVFIWEFVKIVLTVVLLLAAPRVVTDLNWLALLAGFVVTMKASWVAMFWWHRRKTSLTVY